MMELLASHDFQTGLQNYLDLADLRRKLLTWDSSFDSFDEMVEIRHDHYEPLLPAIDTQFRELDSRMRLRIEQHKMLVRRRDDLLTTPQPRVSRNSRGAGRSCSVSSTSRSSTAGPCKHRPFEASLQHRMMQASKGLLIYGRSRPSTTSGFTEFDRKPARARRARWPIAAGSSTINLSVRTTGGDAQLRRIRESNRSTASSGHTVSNAIEKSRPAHGAPGARARARWLIEQLVIASTQPS